MGVELDSLLGDQEPDASFHDALLLNLTVDYAEASLLANFSLCVGDPASPDGRVRERRRAGRLLVRGLLHWSLEPSAEGTPLGRPLWLTSDGLIAGAPTDAGLAIAAVLPGDCFGWYLYFSDINAYAYCAGKHAEFAWL